MSCTHQRCHAVAARALGTRPVALNGRCPAKDRLPSCGFHQKTPRSSVVIDPNRSRSPWISRDAECRGFGTKVRARRDGEENGSIPDRTLQDLASRIVASPIYSVYLQGAVFVGLLGLVDAAYSGDWSRIGAISTEQEDQLKHICIYVAEFHAICTPVAALVASKRGLNWAPLTAKVAAVGGLALLEVLLMPSNE